MLRALLLLLLLAATQHTHALSLSPPPLVDDTRRLSFREVANRASTSVEEAFAAGHRRVSVEVPQMSDAGGTSTARKFEDDNSFLLSLVELLGGGRSPSAVGCNVEIADNWRVSGEYLTEEGLYGYRFPGLSLRLPQGGAVTLLGNSEIGNSALRDLKGLDDGRGRLVLFNMQLDRLSFLDKIGMPPVDDVEPAYLLRRVGASGFVSREFPADFCIWRLPPGAGEPTLVASQPGPFQPQAIDAALRAG